MHQNSPAERKIFIKSKEKIQFYSFIMYLFRVYFGFNQKKKKKNNKKTTFNGGNIIIYYQI